MATVRLILPQSSRTSRSAIKDTIIHSNDTTERADTIKSTNESTDKQIISSDIKPQVEKVSSSSIEVPNTINISNIQRPVISVKELLAFSRVQNHVAKNTVLAFYNPDSKEIGFLMTNFLYVSDRLA